MKKADMVAAIVSNVDNWELEDLIAFAKDVEKARLDKMSAKEVRQEYEILTSGEN